MLFNKLEPVRNTINELIVKITAQLLRTVFNQIPKWNRKCQVLGCNIHVIGINVVWISCYSSLITSWIKICWVERYMDTLMEHDWQKIAAAQLSLFHSHISCNNYVAVSCTNGSTIVRSWSSSMKSNRIEFWPKNLWCQAKYRTIAPSLGCCFLCCEFWIDLNLNHSILVTKVNLKKMNIQIFPARYFIIKHLPVSMTFWLLPC